MSQSSTRTGSQMLSGTLQTFLAEALLFPTGLITAAFLSRSLAPEGYGLYTLAATVVAWLEWCATSVFSRTTIKFVSEADDWLPVGTVIIQQYLLVGTGTAVSLCLLAVPIAQLMREPTFSIYLLLFSLQIPIFTLARAHRNILVGLGRFSEQAIAGSSRWLARLIFIVLLVKLGFSVPGAILGSVGATLVELVISRFYIRPPLFFQSSFPVKQLWNYALPLTLYSFVMRLYDKLDLFMLKMLGGTAEQAGIYGAAQNLALIPGLFALSFTPVLLSNLSLTLRDGNLSVAKNMGKQAMRLVLLILPFAALTAGAAPEIVSLIFGAQYSKTAPILAILIFGSMAQVMISIATAILIAASKPNWTFTLVAPLVPCAIIGHWLLIPRMGEIGAACVTTLFACFVGIASVLAVYKVLQIFPPHQTLWRSIIVCGFTYIMAFFVHTPSYWLLVKLGVIALLIPFLFLLIGEIKNDDIAKIQSLINLKKI